MHQGTVPLPPNLLQAIHAAQYTNSIIINKLIYIMEHMQISTESNLPPGFGFFLDKFRRAVSGEQPDALNFLPERYAFNPYQAYSILATSQSDLTISAGA